MRNRWAVEDNDVEQSHEERMDISQALYHEGRTLMEAGNLEQAVQRLKQSVEMAPHFKTLELLGECLLKLRRPLEAIVPLAAATALNNQVRAPSLLAQALLECGEFLDAGQFASRVLEKAPGNRVARSIMEVPAVKSALASHAGDESTA
jgi:tetratricopeptide (TPR) repeat protein